ncbi:unnamed protein product [Ranitomeya imitator]|uniref:Phospholipid scramblase n=1 Tax=Ranitomeya imitator TaxID=111125 RepID=A0ABN9L0B0_9NEOB|nr:unnamed protein product [Ranitomeya imitator]
MDFINQVFLGTEKSNKYEIKDNFGQRLYFAIEENIYLNKNLCGPLRPFSMHIANNTGREVITVIRPLRCITCCFPCYLQEVIGSTVMGKTADLTDVQNSVIDTLYKEAYSSNLNSIENLWGIVKRKMRDTRPNNTDNLKAVVKATWASITPQQCHRLIASMPHHIDAVIDAKQDPAKY